MQEADVPEAVGSPMVVGGANSGPTVLAVTDSLSDHAVSTSTVFK